MLRRLSAIGSVATLSAACFGIAPFAGAFQLTVQQAGPNIPVLTIPVLTLDEAVATALADNRNVKNALMSIDASREQLLAAKTKRLPSFSAYVFGGETLTNVSFNIKENQFGTYPNAGPIPAHNTTISTSQTPTAFVVAQASQPLLTLRKINLNIRAQGLAVAQAGEQSRSTRQSISASVHQAYYGVVQAEEAVNAAKASVHQYEELDRITAEYVSEKTALKSDNLQVKAKLEQEKYSLMQWNDKLQAGEESLNELLGRDINTQFRTAPVAELSSAEGDLQSAQAKALLAQPAITEAGLTVKQAEIQVRLAKAQYYPDLNLTLHYISPFGISFLPSNIAAAGLDFSWDPFDWGGRGHTVKQKTIVVEQSKQQLEETKAQILVNVDNQFRSLQEAREAVSVARMNQDSTHEKLRETTAQYAQKTALLRDLLQQQAASVDADTQYIQAMAAFWTAKANLDKAIGEE